MWKAPPQEPGPADPQRVSTSRSPMTSSNDASPTLTPQFCFATSTLKEFLRLSRSTTDDTIAQQLNTLSHPPTFDPSTTSTRQPSHRLIPTSTLHTFLTASLYPSWSRRTEVLTYCAIVATSPDPNDPDAEAISKANEADKQRIVNERLDPYSGRYFPRETRAEVLAGVVRNERGVEEIVRERTWEVIKGRSLDGMSGMTWKQAYEEWKKSSSS
ncbi:hypothetical protein H072_9705 [Dactylellina haptotyla CBS 200.50]|uniref:Caffeine-induced death protein Cid2 n=1 Tax=Dactylellina haptotyla (strain CBS 200.50) TaxID=1284197 RepID=S8A1W4_DACHA|nr:hypothetical protein H072_9705 [Dactylellina haptotyla CBS 200.50]